MNRDSLWSLLWLLIPVGLVLGALGVFLWPSPDPAECAVEPMSLISPTNSDLVTQAINELFEEGVVSSIEEAEAAVTTAGWVLDPADDNRLEYWLTLTAKSNVVSTVGFEIVCIAPDETVVWIYDGLQEPGA